MLKFPKEKSPYFIVGDYVKFAFYNDIRYGSPRFDADKVYEVVANGDFTYDIHENYVCVKELISGELITSSSKESSLMKFNVQRFVLTDSVGQEIEKPYGEPIETI